MDDEALLSAAELRTSEVPASYLKGLTQVVRDFDADTSDQVAHFIVTVRKGAAPAPMATVLPTPSHHSDPLSSLVDETMKLTDDITQNRTTGASVKEEFSADYLLSSARLLEESGDLDLARNIYKTLVKKGGAIAAGLSGLGRTYEAESNLADAERHYREALTYSSDAQTYQALVGVLIRLGKDEEAARHLLLALGLPGLTTTQRFEFNKSIGNCHARLGNGDKAAHYYGKAYELNPRSDALQVNVGSLALQKGDLAAAQEHFKKALELNPKNEKAVNGLGMAALAAGNTRQAHDYFAASLEMDISNVGAIYNLVKAAYDLKSYDTAARVLERYMKAHADSRSNTNILYCYCGILFHQGHHNAASEEADRILRLNPQHSGAREIKALIGAHKSSANQGR